MFDDSNQERLLAILNGDPETSFPWGSILTAARDAEALWWAVSALNGVTG